MSVSDLTARITLGGAGLARYVGCLAFAEARGQMPCVPDPQQCQCWREAEAVVSAAFEQERAE